MLRNWTRQSLLSQGWLQETVQQPHSTVLNRSASCRRFHAGVWLGRNRRDGRGCGKDCRLEERLAQLPPGVLCLSLPGARSPLHNVQGGRGLRPLGRRELADLRPLFSQCVTGEVLQGLPDDSLDIVLLSCRTSQIRESLTSNPGAHLTLRNVVVKGIHCIGEIASGMCAAVSRVASEVVYVF